MFRQSSPTSPTGPASIRSHPVARMVIDSFTNEEVDAVYVAYADFVNTTLQRPVVVQLLPVVPAELEASQAVGYIYEPDERPVLDQLLPRYVEMQLYHYLLEGIASEQSARMVAMRNATDNANEMVEDLTLVMNKARQETITKELLDIVGGVAASNNEGLIRSSVDSLQLPDPSFLRKQESILELANTDNQKLTTGY